MARHEGTKEHEKPHLEHARKVVRRARGGEARAERHEAETEEEKKKREEHEGRHKRKHGGKVPGKEMAHRPDRKHRAAGGETEGRLMSEAGKMSAPSFERHQPGRGEGGEGTDKR